MRKTITLGLSIILCLVGSLVLLSLIEVEQVVKAAPKKEKPPKNTTTYTAVLIDDGSGFPACPDPVFNDPNDPNFDPEGPPSTGEPCHLLADEITVEIEDGDLSYQIRWHDRFIFKGVLLSDGTFLERITVGFSAKGKKGETSTSYQAWFRPFPFSPRTQYNTDNKLLQPPGQLPVSQLTPESCVLPFSGSNCVFVEIRDNNFIQQHGGETGGPLREVHLGDIMLQKTSKQVINGVTVITVGE